MENSLINLRIKLFLCQSLLIQNYRYKSTHIHNIRIGIVPHRTFCVRIYSRQQSLIIQYPISKYMCYLYSTTHIDQNGIIWEFANDVSKASGSGRNGWRKLCSEVKLGNKASLCLYILYTYNTYIRL